jgi:UDP-arabinose 4-epimerase
MRCVLVTGGAGYIGSHTCKILAQNGILPIAYDNLINGHREAVRWGPLVVGDIADRHRLDTTFREFRPDAVIHFAAFAYVGESMEDPAKYYRNNVAGSINLLDSMLAYGINKIVFSSTCATYGNVAKLPITEDDAQVPVNPYGRSKLVVETILRDYYSAFRLRYVGLRYFNAAGLDLDGELGEYHDPETHVIPRILMAAAGTLPYVDVLGTDYPTPDGTCIRDYIHVADLALGHLRALSYLEEGGAPLFANLGTGKGTSVAEILKCAEKVTGVTIPTKMQARRPGDPPALYADCSCAQSTFGFTTHHSDIETIIRSAWPFFSHRRKRSQRPELAGIEADISGRT